MKIEKQAMLMLKAARKLWRCLFEIDQAMAKRTWKLARHLFELDSGIWFYRAAMREAKRRSHKNGKKKA